MQDCYDTLKEKYDSVKFEQETQKQKFETKIFMLEK